MQDQKIDIISINDLIDCHYDKIVIAIYNENKVDEVKKELSNFGISNEKIVTVF